MLKKGVMKRVIGLACVIGLTLPTGVMAEECRSMQTAARYAITADKPAVGFFEGALLGNGGLGVVVTTRPDAVCLHFGHNNVWDIRVTENHKDKIGTFAEVFAKADKLVPSLPSIHHDKEFSDYLSLTADNYRSPYPRPFPCGTLLLGFDRRETELLGHSLDVSNGMCKVFFLKDGKNLTLTVFTDMRQDEAWLSLADENGRPAASCFNRLRVIPDPSTPGDIPHYQVQESDNNHIGFYQELPFSTVSPDTSKDKAFALQVFTTQKLQKGQRTTTLGIKENLADLERYLKSDSQPFYVRAVLHEGLAQDVRTRLAEKSAPSVEAYNACVTSNLEAWNRYWQCSGVSLADKELEQMWYRNLYFFNCALRPGATCPGLFANWSYGNIGTAWHGDYHLNYNTQQPFWVTFSSNHLDKNLVFADLIDHLLPVSRKWAKEYYNMRGAFFPHSAYPVEMNLHPYPVPDWGWEVFETPWMVQGLWWHYLYSGDRDFLKNRAFEPIKDAVMFLVDYMTRQDAHGERWGDGKYHIFPSVPPELYGLQPGFKFNYDTQIDLTLAKYVFKAYLEAVDVLDVRKAEKELSKQVRHILTRMPDYSVYESERFGTIYVSVPGERDEIVYNVPANLMHVFPGDEYGIGSPDSIRRILLNTCRAHQNEGGNDIVFLNLQKARLGVLDLEQFKRQVNYATLPNQTVTDAVLQIGGRYSDLTDYMFMGPMGIWFENFALPTVINECLMQSYDGVIRLFPNWDKASDAEFTTLRARGAFLVSGGLKNGQVQPVTILSEQGDVCRIYNPWPGSKVRVEANGEAQVLKAADVLEFKTERDREYTVSPV